MLVTRSDAQPERRGEPLYPLVLTTAHVAEILGIDEDSVRKRVRKKGGGLPMVKRSGSYVIDQVEFRRYFGYGVARSES